MDGRVRRAVIAGVIYCVGVIQGIMAAHYLWAWLVLPQLAYLALCWALFNTGRK